MVAAASGVDPRLAFELRRWQSAEPGRAPDGYTLAWLVACYVRAHGRDHLDGRLLAVLTDVRHATGATTVSSTPTSTALLASYRGSLGSREYLAFPLLELIMADARSGIGAERLAVLAHRRRDPGRRCRCPQRTISTC